MKTLTFVTALLAALCVWSAFTVQESRAAGCFTARAAERQTIRSMHILDRPNRPGHFYGNTKRRRYHNGAAVYVRGCRR
jgi:hypothetical protein